MVKQLGIIHIFSDIAMCWPKMGRTSIYCVYKVSHIDLSDKELKHLNDQEQCNLLNDNQIFVAEPFQYKF